MANQIVKDKRVSKAILSKIEKENELKGNTINPQFEYVESSQSDLEAYYKSTMYKNKKYSVEYFDGCFYPFICEVK